MTQARVRQLFMRLEGRLPLGFGVSGPLATRLFTDGEIDRLIGTARDQEITIFDTAPSYGAGLGERRLGRAIGNDPAAFVMTKAGLTAKGCLKRVSDFTPERIVQSVEDSLRRLKRDRIDLLWLHGPGQHQINDRLCDALVRSIDDGKVAAVGIASRDRAACAMADTFPFSAIMAPIREAKSGLAPLPSGIAFFGIEGLGQVPLDHGIPRNRSGLWRTTRALVRGKSRLPEKTTARAAFGYAFETADCDVVVTTTTKSARIQENSLLCAAFVDRLRGSQLLDSGQAHAGSNWAIQR
ncbi:MAG: aldo/keto reductase [Pseudomonadota bacterium]